MRKLLLLISLVGIIAMVSLGIMAGGEPVSTRLAPPLAAQVGGGSCVLIMQINGPGNTSPAAGNYSYECGTYVNIAAISGGFYGWTGDPVADPMSPNTTVLVGDAGVVTTVTANFVPIPTPEPTCHLIIQAKGNGTTYPPNGEHYYHCPSVVTITAYAAPGWMFANWTGDPVVDQYSATTTVTVASEYTTVVANFVPAPGSPTLMISPQSGNPGAVITLSGSYFTPSAAVDIAIGSYHYPSTFITDSNGAFSVSETVPVLPPGNYTITADDHMGNSATAIFLLVVPTLNLTPNSGIAGSEVTITGSNWMVGNISLTFGGAFWHMTFADSNGDIDEPGVAIPSSATPGNWTVTGIGMGGLTASTTFVVVSGPGPTPSIYWLEVKSGAGGHVTEPGEGNFSYIPGSIVSLVATPDVNNLFVNWTGDIGTIGAPTNALTTITMDSNYSIQVNFVPVMAPTLYLTPISGIAGTEVTIAGSHWAHGNFTSPVTLTFAGAYWHTAYADGSGDIYEPGTAIPSSATPGNWTVTGIGIGNETASTTFVVVNNTPAGNNTSVVAQDPQTGNYTPVTMTFSEVTNAGDTTAEASETGPAPPEGFQLGTDPPTYFDIDTTADYTPPVEICIDYSGMNVKNEKKLQLMHWNGTNWEDVTTSLDTVNDIICGEVTTLSVFVIVVDTTPPSVAMVSPPSGCSLQDGVAFIASATDSGSGVSSVTFSIREDNGDDGIIIGLEDLPGINDSGTNNWNLWFDTLQLQDGWYVVLVKAIDNAGNVGSIKVPYSIRNWAAVKLLPSTPDNKAGRTMPVKFALRVSDAVDPAQPFVYNDDLTIKIFATSDPGHILQTSTFGTKASDYRIDTAGELYITNFQTSKDKKEYTVEIWRTGKNFMVGYFTFQTVK
jgi:hypothetical protein